MNTKIRYGLSAAVLALIDAGASAPQILDQFLDEKGNHKWHTAMVLAYGPSVGVPQWWMENRFSQYETVEGKMRPRSTPLSVIRRWHGWSAILKYH